MSLLYDLTGTLNMADLAQRVPQLGPDRSLLVQSAALLLIVVFGVKAALIATIQSRYEAPLMEIFT